MIDALVALWHHHEGIGLLVVFVMFMVWLNRYAPAVVVLILAFITGLLRGLLGR